MTYSIEAATEYGAGIGPNGTGRRSKVQGFYVVDQTGRRCRAFSAPNAKPASIDELAKAKAAEWAEVLNQRMGA